MARSSGAVTGVGNAGSPPSAGPPSRDLSESFARLEQRIEEVVGLVAHLRSENADLARRLAREERLRRAAAARIDALLDKVDTMT